MYFALPKSALQVFNALEDRPISSKELARKTNLSERTVRYALKVLKENGLVEEIFFLRDARRRGYKRKKLTPG
ncbi:ArsR family transcriptional regulator [Thermococcus sp. MV5]|uniref:helix-turn-helix domain-containing protein n=1 Tax=Thermococcus sp. MV5 TaxID=1638272 RepID=UPI001438D208|nr:ArsR family transcriptional regulator [Thermococcus sp. MV5]